ncbi:beta-galactosidase [Dactylosporangium matsuzakiense]|uniref:Glycoside hydrolase 35 catalytic domain-containing protein n=1 Tax=Dactylosporangium matsuzakiense TaxID=53360 RepID=A0A9W6KGW6_9ACTN|nr:beta-galactosidase [Dactylosporangium matsuzakiense]GLL00514.1 hypothetical protein GCM10017581_022550 [Dactylosporangium matsuzakiense]
MLRRDGRPWIPVSGELHYSRVPRPEWERRLDLMRSGGVSVVSTYVPWIHHEARRGAVRFGGNLDLAAFVDLCRAGGFEVVLRIGPWVHGELRNGGFPDWVQAAPVRHRTDDPAYLDLVADWFGRIGGQVGGREDFLAIQVENELLDQPGHLVTLKRLAIGCGLTARLWTATAWDGAQLPAGEVLPVHSGYGDGFWIDAGAPWPGEFREQYFIRPPAADPFVTCELAGGMATAYHRRPRPSALDIAAIAHNAIAAGSVWQGYYMYAGGTNPPGTQESHASGCPNDVPPLGYDFHAPIGEAGLLCPTHAELRRQHAFLTAFAEHLIGAATTWPAEVPPDVTDTGVLREATRGPFRFISWHQPHVPLETHHGTVDIPPGTLARWPLGLEVGGVRIDRATATALTVLPGPVPTLVLCAHAGIPVELETLGATHRIEPGRTPHRLPGLDVLTLTPEDTGRAWVHSDGRLLLSAADLSWDATGRITAHAAAEPEVLIYNVDEFEPLPLTPVQLETPPTPATPDAQPTAPEAARTAEAAESRAAAKSEAEADEEAVVEIEVIPMRRPGPVPAIYGVHGTRQSAPAPAEFDARAAVYRLPLPPRPSDAILHIDWAGDVAELRIDGHPATDRFWDGSRLSARLPEAAQTATLHVLPLAPDNPVHLPADAQRRRSGVSGPLLAVDRVTLERRRTWRE